MQVTCNKCSKPIVIPDDKVPKDQAFNVTCPGCKTRVRVDAHVQKVKLSHQEDTEPHPLDEYDSIDTTLLVTDEEFDDEEEILEIYDEDDKVALIMDPAHEDNWTAALTALEYKTQTANTPDHGVHKLKFNQYHVIVFNEEFGDHTLETSPLYRYIVNMPMNSRRKAFVILVGKKFKSTDNMEALSYSVNLVLNEKDIDQLDLILKKTINENEIFYKIFKETLQTHGKL